MHGAGLPRYQLFPTKNTIMRNGKIAKLPDSVRNELNPRMERGESGETILAWLNGLPAVQTILQEEFEGAPISKQSAMNGISTRASAMLLCPIRRRAAR